MFAKRRQQGLTFKQKLEILEKIKNGKTRKDLAKEYKCDISTISRILRDADKYHGLDLKTNDISKKRMRSGKYEKLEEEITFWYNEMKDKNIKITGPMIFAHAKTLAMKSGIEFEPSNGWLCRWKKRKNITSADGKKHSSNSSIVRTSNKNLSVSNSFNIPEIMNRYTARNIYNANEIGMFYKALPAGPLEAEGEIYLGSKAEKDRITIIFIVNMDGSERFAQVIGRSREPRCFQGKKVSLPYHTSPNAWMTSVIWTQIWLDYNDTLKKQKRKIVVFANDSPCHQLEDGIELENIKFVFFPGKETESLHPLNTGIIRSFKVYYRQQLLRKHILAIEKGIKLEKFSKTITLLRAIQLIEKVWSFIKPSTILNSFHRCGFQRLPNPEHIHSEPSDIIEIPIGEKDFNTFVDFDENLVCYDDAREIEIKEESESNSKIDNEDDDSDDEEEYKSRNVTRQEALNALDTVRLYLESCSGDTKYVDLLENQVMDITIQTSVER